MNKEIIINLESLFKENYNVIQFPPLSQWLDVLVSENPDIYSINEQKTVKLYDKSIIQNFEQAKKSTKLIEQYEKTISMSLNESEIILNFSNDLKSSFTEMKKGMRPQVNSKIQIILLTYDHEPYAWISGFGEGIYPILKKAEYFDFNYQKDFFKVLGKVDYSIIWDNLIKLEECLEEMDIMYDIFDTHFHQCIRNAYIYKTYLLLNKAFQMNEKELFSNLDIQKPLFIYGHEHDCEKMNIYCYN